MAIVFPQIPPYIPLTIGDFLKRARIRVLFYWRKLLPPPDRETRAKVQLQLREDSEPDFDYFVLVVLSATIATFGLLINSAATIIGAMLVAPLMSPLLGLGLASIRGDTLLLRYSITGLIRGAILAVLVAAAITWINSRLPFISLQELPAEVIARSRPSPIDLGVALAGGLAAAFAMALPNLSAALPGVAIATAIMPPLCVIGVGIALGDWEVASGATLLFITNAVTIAAAGIALFYAMGFGIRRKEGEGFFPRSLVISGVLTAFLLAPLGYQSYQFYQQAQRTTTINDVVSIEVSQWPDVELVSVESNQVGDILEIEVTVRTLQSLTHEDSVALREAIDIKLQQPVELSINQILAARLDPRVPPTLTPTAVLSITPSVLATDNPTVIPSATTTAMPTATETPLPGQALLSNTFGQASVSLRQSPGGITIGYLPEGSQLTVLYGYEVFEGWVWIEVQDQGGRVGWIPQFYTEALSSDPSDSAE